MSGTTISVYRRQAISKWVTSSKGYTYFNKPADTQKPAITKGIWIVITGPTMQKTTSDAASGCW